MSWPLDNPAWEQTLQSIPGHERAVAAGAEGFGPVPSEKHWWARLSTLWGRDGQWGLGGSRGRPQQWPTRLEPGSPPGLADVHIADAAYPGRSQWLELKNMLWPERFPRQAVKIPFQPEQAIWLWRQRAYGRMPTSVLVSFTNRPEWLWLPVVPTPDWVEKASSGNGWLMLPHICGLGPVPPIVLLYRLPWDGRLTLCPPGPARDLPHGTPNLSAWSTRASIPWPSTLSESTNVSKQSVALWRRLAEHAAQDEPFFWKDA